MDDVAERLGVSKGTVYRSVDSKDALLVAVLDFADEVAAITRELFDVLASCRVGVMVLDRCAPELPDLAAEWFGSGRYALVDAWSVYLDRHATMITGDVPIEVLARSITELVTTWAVKTPWDPAPRLLPSDTAAACAAMVRNLVIGGPR